MSEWIGYLSVFVLGMFVGVVGVGIWLDYVHRWIDHNWRKVEI